MSEANSANPSSDALRKLAPLALGAAAVVGSQVGVDLPPWVQEMLKQWGPAGILLLGVAYYVPRTAIRDFISATQAQAVAMQKVGDQLQVMTGQAGKLDELKGLMEDVNLNQRVIIDRLKNLESQAADHET